MAEPTVKELQQQLAAANARNAELEQAAITANAVLPVKGKYKASWKNPLTGKSETVEVAFVDGHKNLFLAGKRLPTEAVLKCANGAELSAEEVKSLQGLTEEGAQKHLTHLAKIGYAYLK